ncbi:MAG: hypothetical protein KDD43_13625 [Bdellovibrionales bacterium]|nr:hypothetical protein [Bdellovibrionales bacterium]
MKNVVLCLLISLVGCVSQQYLTEDQASRIGKGSEVVEFNMRGDSAEVYTAIYKALVNAGFRIAHDNREMLTISTEGKDIEQDTKLRMLVVMQPGPYVVRVVLRGEWLPGSQTQAMASGIAGRTLNVEWFPARWGRQTGRPELSFAYMVKFARELSQDVWFK